MLALLPLNCWTPFTTAPFNSLLGKLWLTAVSSMEKSVVSGCPRPARVLIYASMLLNLQRYLTLAVEQAWHQLTGQQSALKVPQTDSELGQTGFQYYNTSVLERTRSEELKKTLILWTCCWITLSAVTELHPQSFFRMFVFVLMNASVCDNYCVTDSSCCEVVISSQVSLDLNETSCMNTWMHPN